MTDQSMESSLWVVCDCSGEITLCGRDASDFGARPGDSAVSMIAEDGFADFEDALRVAERGGVVDLILPAPRGRIAHVKSDELFASPVMIISLYKNKNEYLAAALSSGDKIGKVFSHMEGYVSAAVGNDGKVTALTVENSTRAIVIRNKLIGCIPYEARTGDVSADISAIFDMIAEKFSANAENRFRVNFLSEIRGNMVLCPVDPRMFAGVTVMCAAVGARISCDGECSVMLSADSDTAMLTVTSKMKDRLGRSFKCSDLVRLCRLIPSTPTELIILEGMVSEFDRDSIFECREDGSFILRITFDIGADSDRLKFREEIAITSEYVDSCMEHIGASPSSESQ